MFSYIPYKLEPFDELIDVESISADKNLERCVHILTMRKVIRKCWAFKKSTLNMIIPVKLRICLNFLFVLEL